MLDDKKKTAQLILGGLNGETQDVPSDASAGLEAAMQKFINCVSAKDAKGCTAALCQFMEMYEMMSEPLEG